MGRFRDFCFYKAEFVEPVTWPISDSDPTNFFSPDFAAKTYQLDDMGWANDINSYKCGKHVMIEMCQYPEDKKSRMSEVAPTVDWTMKVDFCQEAYGENRSLAANSDLHDQVTLKLKPNDPCTGMIYDKPGCSGDTTLVRPDITYN